MAARMVSSLCTLVAAHRAISSGRRPDDSAAAAMRARTAWTCCWMDICNLSLSLQVTGCLLYTSLQTALMANTTGDTTYTVVKGDTFNAIAYACLLYTSRCV